MKYRIIIVDDSALYRLLVKRAISKFSDLEILYEASDGKEALAQIKKLKPDFVISDVEMPVMNGLELLKNIKKEKINVGVIMLSGASRRNANITIEALSLGAFDFIEKPTAGNPNSNFDHIGNEIHEKLLLYKSVNKRVTASSARQARNRVVSKPVKKIEDKKRPLRESSRPIRTRATKSSVLSHYDLILVGISTGGPKTLIKVFSELKKTLPVPMLIVQHMPPMFTKSLAENLDKKSSNTVKEAADGEITKPGHVYIAPGGKHLELEQAGSGYRLKITNRPPVNSCKPSVDTLFKSAKSIVQKKKVLVMVLTGMGRDGRDGVKDIKSTNTTVIAQDEETSIIYGMPKAVVDANLHDEKMSIDEIINLLNSLW